MGVEVMVMLARVWDVLVLTRLEEEGEAFNMGLPDQRPAGESAGYWGKNNRHSVPSSRHQSVRRSDRTRGVGVGGSFKLRLCFCCTSFVEYSHISEGESNSTETDIKLSVKETRVSSKPDCNSSAWQKSLSSDNTVPFFPPFSSPLSAFWRAGAFER